MSNSQWHADQAHGERAMRENAQREDRMRSALDALAAAARRLIAAKIACDAEAERHPSSRSSAPMVRYIGAMQALEDALLELDAVQ